MRREEIEALKELCEKATQGRWSITDLRHQQGGQVRVWSPGGSRHVANVMRANENATADAAFIAAARTALPKLIEEIRRLHAALPPESGS